MCFKPRNQQQKKKGTDMPDQNQARNQAAKPQQQQMQQPNTVGYYILDFSKMNFIWVVKIFKKISWFIFEFGLSPEISCNDQQFQISYRRYLPNYFSTTLMPEFRPKLVEGKLQQYLDSILLTWNYTFFDP